MHTRLRLYYPVFLTGRPPCHLEGLDKQCFRAADPWPEGTHTGRAGGSRGHIVPVFLDDPVPKGYIYSPCAVAKGVI